VECSRECVPAVNHDIYCLSLRFFLHLPNNLSYYSVNWVQAEVRATTEGDFLKDIETIISQLEEQRSAIERAISALRDIGGSEAILVKKGRPGRPPAIAGDSPAPVSKRRLSPEGRKRIVQALKKRWAAKKAAGKRTGAKKGKKAGSATTK
jgi:hypothetical protein